MITCAALTDPERLRHGFLTRRGGVSRGLYESFNCGAGSGDEAAAVLTNRAIAAQRLGLAGAPVVTVRQVHSAKAIVVDGPWPGEPPQGDALVSNTPAIVIGVLSADCTPVLLADTKAGVVAAAHAGWKGALLGVLEATVQTMESLGAHRPDIRAAIGPCIAQQSYEVGAEFRARFVSAKDTGDNCEALFLPSERPGHFLFDLRGFVAMRLERLALGRVDVLDHDTYAREDLFFSYRRATHKKEGGYGRQLSAIALCPAIGDKGTS